MRASVIFSTYNSTEWLEKVLWGYSVQTVKDFEIVVADDGSGPETKKLLDKLQSQIGVPVRHVWQEDEGFQKSRILNKAIVAAQAEYLIFSDGDCIPRADFVEAHLNNRKEGHFLSGGYFLLPMQTSKAITKEDILSQNCFDVGWLMEHGLKWTYKTLKLRARGTVRNLLNKLTTTKASWNGHNSSGWKADIVAANGFDERMQYGGQDRELGERLENSGVRGVQIRYTAVVVHLDHKRGYRTRESIAKNRGIRDETKRTRSTRTAYGIIKSQQPE